MTPIERLRVAAALGHAIDGARLVATGATGERVVIGHQPDADLDPCAFRQVVIASACPHRPDPSGHIVHVKLTGAADDLGGGVVRTRTGSGPERRWIASLLRPETVVETIDGSVGIDGDDAVTVSVAPDAALGVSLVVVSGTGHGTDAALDEIAVRVAAACYREELVRRAERAGPDGTTPADGR